MIYNLERIKYNNTCHYKYKKKNKKNLKKWSFYKVFYNIKKHYFLYFFLLFISFNFSLTENNYDL